jgi:hypothetical protein
MDFALYQRRHPRRTALIALAAAWALSHLPMAWISGGAAYDMESYHRVCQALAEGQGLYGNPELIGRYPYGPLWALFLFAVRWSLGLVGIPESFAFKIPALSADLGLGFLIYMILSRLSPEPGWLARPFWAALGWILNPVALLISAGHGQFDSLALFFVLAALWYLDFSEHPGSDFASALSLGFAVALKTWPLFFLPFFIRCLPARAERWRYALICLAFPFLLLLPFVLHGGLDNILDAMRYSGASAFSLPESLRGFFYSVGAKASSYRTLAELWRNLALICLGLGWLMACFGPWRLPMPAALSLAVLTLYVFAPAFSPQYLCWLIPFALLIPGNLALLHTAAALPCLLIFYGLFMPEAFLKPGDWAVPNLPRETMILWGLINLGLWIFFARQWSRMLGLCLRPQGRLEFL